MANGSDERPSYRLTGRVNGDRKRWVTCGAAWNSVSRNGVPYISIRVDALPIGFDGTLALHEITEEERDQE